MPHQDYRVPTVRLGPQHSPGKRIFLWPTLVYVPTSQAIRTSSYDPDEIEYWPKRRHWLERKHVFWLVNREFPFRAELEIPCVWSATHLNPPPSRCERCGYVIDAEGHLWPVR